MKKVKVFLKETEGLPKLVCFDKEGNEYNFVTFAGNSNKPVPILADQVVFEK